MPEPKRPLVPACVMNVCHIQGHCWFPGTCDERGYMQAMRLPVHDQTLTLGDMRTAMRVPDPATIGALGGPCNRTACRRPGAYWWNPHTRKHYCRQCAWAINEGLAGEGLALCEDRSVPGNGEYLGQHLGVPPHTHISSREYAFAVHADGSFTDLLAPPARFPRGGEAPVSWYNAGVRHVWICGRRWRLLLPFQGDSDNLALTERAMLRFSLHSEPEFFIAPFDELTAGWVVGVPGA